MRLVPDPAIDLLYLFKGLRAKRQSFKGSRKNGVPCRSSECERTKPHVGTEALQLEARTKFRSTYHFGGPNKKDHDISGSTLVHIRAVLFMETSILSRGPKHGAALCWASSSPPHALMPSCFHISF